MRTLRIAGIVCAVLLTPVTSASAGDAWVAWAWGMHSGQGGHWGLWNAYADLPACKSALRDKRDDLLQDNEKAYVLTRDDIEHNGAFAVKFADRYSPDGFGYFMYRCLPAGVHP